MFLDARQVPASTTLEADICIIGAGAAGITIAHEMIGKPHKVIVLESGGLEMAKEDQSLNAGEIVGLNYPALETGRSRYFGGGTNCWGGWCRPLEEIDFEKRDWVPHSGWPFDREALAPFYARAHEMCGVPSQDYSTSNWNERLAPLGLATLPLKDDRVVTQISQVAKQPRFGIAYRDEIGAAENVEVYLHANVVEIETDDSAKKVSSLRVATLEGNEFRVSSTCFVLASGGIENPRLLLLSNRVQKAGLGNQHDLVGRFFMEHPRVHAGEIVLNDPSMSTDLYDPQYTYFHSPVGAHLALTADTLRAEKLINFKTWIITVWHGEESPGGVSLKNLYRAVRKTTLPDHFMETSAGFWAGNIANVMWDFPHTAAVICGRLFKPKWLIKKFMFANFCEPAPNRDSRVTLSTQKDALGLNRVCLDWKLSALDKHTIGRAHQIINEAVQNAGIGRIDDQLPVDDDNSWPEDLSWGWHHMGTTRMHDDPKQGVVDRDCRVHGMENLYIAGSSVFPTSGNDLPTMTIVALAMRLADHLKNALR